MNVLFLCSLASLVLVHCSSIPSGLSSSGSVRDWSINSSITSSLSSSSSSNVCDSELFQSYDKKSTVNLAYDVARAIKKLKGRMSQEGNEHIDSLIQTLSSLDIVAHLSPVVPVLNSRLNSVLGEGFRLNHKRAEKIGAESHQLQVPKQLHNARVECIHQESKTKNAEVSEQEDNETNKTIQKARTLIAILKKKDLYKSDGKRVNDNEK